MHNNNNDIYTEVAEYYSEKLAAHGETAQGVDWNGEQGQNLRFEQLYKLIDARLQFSINDLGCGYGALYSFVADRQASFNYTGIDIAENMILAAKQRYKESANANFIVSNEPDKVADYSVASGIFNVRFNRLDGEWDAYIEETLDLLDRTSLRGFAFNCLTSYSDAEKMRENLYYADPCKLFDFCKRRYSKDVALLHDYGLYEFTIIVRKNV